MCNNGQELEKIIDQFKIESRKMYGVFKEVYPHKPVSDFNDLFLIQKLAEFEQRLRRLEEGNSSAQSYLNLHTPLI